MIRAKLPLESIVARPTLQPEFFNSLGDKRTFTELIRYPRAVA